MTDYIDINIVNESSSKRDKKKAESRCLICDKPIGMNVEFVLDPDLEGLVHLACLETDKPRI